MQTTYKNFSNLSTLYTGDTSNLDNLALEYQRTEDPILLAVVFCRQYPYILTQTNKYFNLSESDKASFVVEELHKSMKDFQTGKGAKIQTLFSRYLNRRLYAETSMLNHQKRSANNSADSYEEVAETNPMKYEEEAYENYELIDSLKSADILTDNELKYCRIIMTETDKVRDSEIARELGITASAINQLKKALKKKFLNLSICY